MNNLPKPSAIRRAHRNAMGGARKRCVKGKSCGAACIFAQKTCLLDLPDPLQSDLSKASQMIQSRGGISTTNNPSPTAPPAPKAAPVPKSPPKAVPDKNVWQSAEKGDYSQVKKQTDRWAKEHGLKTIDGHDHAHSMIHSYMGVNSDILARIGGGKKGDITPMEEGIVYHFDKIGRDRSGSQGSPVPKLSREEIRANIAPMIQNIGKGQVQGDSQRSEQTIQRATNIIYNLQNRKDYTQFVDAIAKTQNDIIEESFKGAFR